MKFVNKLLKVRATNKTVIFITHSIDEALIISDTILIMTARPGMIKKRINNDLPRPRNLSIQLLERYGELKKEIWETVEEEVKKTL